MTDELDWVELNRGAGGKKVAGRYVGDNTFIQLIGTSRVIIEDSVETSLGTSGTFTGAWADVSMHDSAVVAVKASSAGSLLIDFSPNGSDVDSTLSYDVAAETNEVHRVTITRKYIRVRYQNNGTPQTYMRLQTMAGNKQILVSPINSVVQADADATIARTFDEETLIAEGKYAGRSIVNKFGRNPTITSGSVPEDVWNNSTTYTGFPTDSPDELTVVSTDPADTGTLTFTYLASSTSTAWQTASVTMNGLTPVNTGVTAYRVHTAQYATGAATTFNAGTITIYHRNTPANIFIALPVGRSQSYVAAYTVPAGSTGRITRLFARLYSSVASNAEGALWVRTLGGSPRLRRPWTIANSDAFEERPYGGLTIPAGADVVMRVTAVTTGGSIEVIAGFDLTLVADD